MHQYPHHSTQSHEQSIRIGTDSNELINVKLIDLLTQWRRQNASDAYLLAQYVICWNIIFKVSAEVYRKKNESSLIETNIICFEVHNCDDKTKSKRLIPFSIARCARRFTNSSIGCILIVSNPWKMVLD
jgi:hypothetical protein